MASMKFDSGCVFDLVKFLPSYVGTDRPALVYLNRYVKAGITVEWFNIGVELVRDETALNNINCKHPADPGKCTSDMLQLWLQRKPDANWNQLIQAFRAPNIELENLAVKIEGMLRKGM